MKIKANAKINLSLKLCGKRADGYHLIDTVMHSVSLFDELEISKANKISVICDNLEIKQDENIACKAAQLFFDYTGIKGGAKIIIKKHIPTCAGLGGGSADAAAVLLALDKLYETSLKNTTLCEIALKLGADVPFFIEGGCQRAQGIGEVLTKEKPINSGWILLAKGDKKPSTAQMYKIVDGMKLPEAQTEIVLQATQANDLKLLAANLKNAFFVVWEQSLIYKRLLSTPALAVSLSGSGPTFFAIFENKTDAQAAYNKLKLENVECYFAAFENKAIIFE